MFDATWSEIVEAPGEIYDVIEYKEEWEKDDKFNVEDYINGNTDYWCLKHFQSNAHLTNSFQFTWNSCYSAALFFFFGLILRHVQSSVMVYTMPLRLCVLIDTNCFDSQVFLLLRIAAASGRSTRWHTKWARPPKSCIVDTWTKPLSSQTRTCRNCRTSSLIPWHLLIWQSIGSAIVSIALLPMKS